MAPLGPHHLCIMQCPLSHTAHLDLCYCYKLPHITRGIGAKCSIMSVCIMTITLVSIHCLYFTIQCTFTAPSIVRIRTVGSQEGVLLCCFFYSPPLPLPPSSSPRWSHWVLSCHMSLKHAESSKQHSLIGHVIDRGWGSAVVFMKACMYCYQSIVCVCAVCVWCVCVWSVCVCG